MTFWDRLSTHTLDARPRHTPVIVPIAATEQHGPHLPLATDRILADHIAADLDRRVGDAVLILPTAAIGCSDHHNGFAGTLSLRHTTLLGYLEDVVGAVADQDFDNIVILNAHGGNQGIAQVALERLGARFPHIRIANTSWWRLAAPELLDISESGPGGTGHACELETSMMLVAAPDFVHMDLAPARRNAPSTRSTTATCSAVPAPPSTAARKTSRPPACSATPPPPHPTKASAP